MNRVILCIFVIILTTNSAIGIFSRDELTTKPAFTKRIWRTVALEPQNVVTVHHNYSRVQIHGSNPDFSQYSNPIDTNLLTETRQSKSYRFQPEVTQVDQQQLGTEEDPIWTRPERYEGQIEQQGHYIVQETENVKESSELKIDDKLMRLEYEPKYKLELRPNESPNRAKPYSNMAFENCPKNATGPLAYLWSCSQFLNCWKGRGIVQNCAPGTKFNPETLECDYPHKVSCISGAHDQKVKSEKYTQQQICQENFSGLLPHPTICTKFVNCVFGQSYEQDCGPGTAFNAVLQACDYPHKVGCEVADYIVQNGPVNNHLSEGFYSGSTADFNSQYLDRNAQGSTLVRVYDQNLIRQQKEQRNCGRNNCASPREIVQNYDQTRSEYSSRAHSVQYPQNNERYTQTTTQVEVKCPQGHNGLLAHPYICEKFLNCANGATFIQDCGPGTVFNPNSKVCDWPYNVQCTTKTTDDKRETTNVQISQSYGQNSGQSNQQNNGRNYVQTTHGTALGLGQNSGQYHGHFAQQNTTRYGTNTGQNYGQSIHGTASGFGQNTGQYYGSTTHGTATGYGQNSGQYHGHSSQQNTTRYGTNSGQNTGHYYGSTTHGTGTGYGQNAGQNYGQSTLGTTLGLGQNTGQYHGQSVQQSTTSFGSNTGQNYRPTTQGPASGYGQNSGQYHGHVSRQNTTWQGANTGLNYGQSTHSTGQNTGQYHGHTIQQSTTSFGSNSGQHYRPTTQSTVSGYGQNTGQYHGHTSQQSTTRYGSNSGLNYGQTTHGAATGYGQNVGQNSGQYHIHVSQQNTTRCGSNPGQNCGQSTHGTATEFGQNSGQIHGTPTGYGQNVGQNTGQYHIHHSHHNTTRHGSNSGQIHGQSLHGTPSWYGQNAGQNSGQYHIHHSHHNTTRHGSNSGQIHGQSLHGTPSGYGQNVGQNTGQYHIHHTHRNITGYGSNSGQIPGQSIHATPSAFGQNSGQYHGHSSHQNTTRYGSNSGQHYVGSTHTSSTGCGQNCGQSYGQNTGQPIGQPSTTQTHGYTGVIGYRRDHNSTTSTGNQNGASTNPNYDHIRPIYHRNYTQNHGNQNTLEIIEPASPTVLNYSINVAQNNRKTGRHWPPPFPSTDTSADYYFEEVTETSPTKTAPKVWKNTKSCNEGEFECSFNECIPEIWHCDGEQDCRNGADEKNCKIYLNKYKTIPNSRLYKHEVEKWLNTDLETCANYCLKSKSFGCRSFNFRKDENVCLLCDTNVGLSGALANSQLYDYYEISAYSVNCTNKYQCSNGKCINFTQICDGNDDCGNRQDEKNCAAEAIGYEIKLGGGQIKNEGRIEVKVFNEWGYICDDKFGLRNADVVCKELGFLEGALEVKPGSFFAKDVKENETYYLMDDVQCIGNETSIRNCEFNGWGIHNCMPQEIVGVVCKTPQEKCPEDHWKCDTTKECLPLQFVCDGVFDCEDRSDEGVQHCEAPIELRLVNGTSKNEGRVEVRYHGVWGTICDDDFNDMTAKVVCKSLGYHGSSVAKKDAAFGAGIGPIWLDQVNCLGNESNIDDCVHWNWGEHNCEHSEDAGVVCSDLDSSQFEKKSREGNIVNIVPVKPNIDEAIFKGKCGFRGDDLFTDENDENSDVHFRVVKGSIARKGDYPWQATIRVKGKLKSTHWCGAVVISDKYVLTAAHCLVGFAKGSYIVRAGDYDVNEEEGTEVEAFIEDFFVHERFRQGGHMNNDIALIKLKGQGLKLSKQVQPICLPSKDTNYRPGLNCTISGFGSTETGKSSSSHQLRAGWVTLQSDETCKMPQVYGEAITKGMICAGSLDEGIDSCDGDSGGPLACLDNGLFTLYGITSWGQRCGHVNKPGVYVKVSEYREWIDKIIEDTSY